MRLADLFADEKTGKLSSSKVWLNVGCAALTYALLRTPLTAELVMAYGGVVVGNNVAVFWLKRKYRHAHPAAE